MGLLERIKNFLIAAYFGACMAGGHILIAIVTLPRVNENSPWQVFFGYCGGAILAVAAITWIRIPFFFLLNPPHIAWSKVQGLYRGLFPPLEELRRRRGLAPRDE